MLTRADGSFLGPPIPLPFEYSQVLHAAKNLPASVQQFDSFTLAALLSPENHCYGHLLLAGSKKRCDPFDTYDFSDRTELEALKDAARRVTSTLRSRMNEDSRAIFGRMVELHSRMSVPDESNNARLVQWSDELRKLRSGPASASRFHDLIIEVLTGLFEPRLRHPVKEERIHHGRKRLDVVFHNAADDGFFWGLVTRHKIHAPYVLVECKNYSVDPANPEIDQIAGRFGLHRGQFGLLVCRKVINAALLLSRCRDTVGDSRGFVMILDDDDIHSLIKLHTTIGWKGPEEYLEDRLRQLLL